MTTETLAPQLTTQPRRIAAAQRAHFAFRSSRFFTSEETAALLQVSEDVLRRWYVMGYGVQPVPRPEGRLYRAEHVERLAAMPRPERMLAISRRRY